jgi:hypothetical protein
LQFFRGIEVQGRGALHDHAMVWSPVPLRKTAVGLLALAAGFGCQLDLVDCAPGSKRASYYVSKYITKATDSRGVVPWMGEVIDQVDELTGEISFTEGQVDARYRTWSMSREWGLTMAAVKADAAVYAAGKRAEVEAANIAGLVLAFGCELITSSETPPAPS